MANSPEERQHWRDILKAFDGYMQYHLSANHVRRMAFLELPKEDREMYETIGYRDKLEAVDEGIRRNSEFIDLLIEDPVFADMLHESDRGHHGDSHGHDHGHGHGSHDHAPHGHSHSHSHDHASHSHSAADTPSSSHAHSTHPSKTPPPKLNQRERDQQQDKVRSTLRSFVRDWAVEGARERAACYGPILAALEARFPDVSSRARAKVLVPGCGLGRLVMEIAARGFWAQGNEFSTYMLIGSHFALNQSTVAEEHQIFPWLHSFSNHQSTASHVLRSVRVPDVVPAEILSGPIQPGGFSLVAGDFEEVYGPSQWHATPANPAATDEEDEESGNVNQRGRWSAITTCFFIDTARSVLTYLRIIHGLLAEGGVWVNLGPLLWHFENTPAAGAKGERSIELSLDEVLALAREVGFEIKEHKMVRSTYTGTPDGMLEHVYNSAFWTATKLPASKAE